MQLAEIVVGRVVDKPLRLPVFNDIDRDRGRVDEPSVQGLERKAELSPAQIAVPGARQIAAYCSKVSPENWDGNGASGGLYGEAASIIAAFSTVSAANGTGAASGSAEAASIPARVPAAAKAPPSANPKNSRRCGAMLFVSFARRPLARGEAGRWAIFLETK